MNPDQITHIFFPHTEKQAEAIKADGLRLAYYTTAATAYSIIRNCELWMRNTSTMNDYREVEHGFDCLNAAIKSPEGEALKSAIDQFFPDLTQQAIDHFNGWLPHIRQDTYITCVSEHFTHEDNNGRLSMWRAYGGNSGVALVFKPDALFKPKNVGVYVSPVAYWTQVRVQQEMALIAARVRESAAIISAADPTLIRNVLFNMFRFAVLCTKHPGFAEEREWRLINCPALEKSPLLQQTIEVVRGTPQLVQHIRMKDLPEYGIHDVTLAALLDRIIIGPCEYPDATYKAMIQLLKDAEFVEPRKIVHVSDIPLRVASV